LVGSHTVGRTLTAFPGHNGPWTLTPFVFDNTYFTALKPIVDNENRLQNLFQDFSTWWKDRNSAHTVQFPPETGRRTRLMLDVDISLCFEAPNEVTAFAASNQHWRRTFNRAFVKMSELGFQRENGLLTLPDL